MLAFGFWFIIGLAMLCVVVILAKYLLSLAGITIPQPILICIGILLFIFFMVALWHFVGAAAWDTAGPHRLS